MGGVIVGIFGAAALAVLIYLMVRSGDAAEKPKTVRRELEADGVRDLIAEERIDEAVDLYRKFAGVDEYTARDAIEQIRREMK